VGARALAAVVIGAGAAFAGCYGSTEPANDVGSESATFNGHGTANNGPASAYFQYYKEEDGHSSQETARAHFPGGASGPFSMKVTGLAASAGYSYRLCGSDDGGGQIVCAQWRHFQTSAPVEDSATGHWDSGPGLRGNLDARSGPSGENPRGFIHSNVAITGYGAFDGNVTCVAVNGKRAAVGAVGTVIPPTGSPDPQPATYLLTIEDRVYESDTLGVVQTQGSTPPNCATASFANQRAFVPPDSELVVNDAPASAPTGAR
jgi:hypothetical protein